MIIHKFNLYELEKDIFRSTKYRVIPTMQIQNLETLLETFNIYHQC